MVPKINPIQICVVKKCQKIDSKLKQSIYRYEHNPKEIDVLLYYVHYQKDVVDAKYHTTSEIHPKEKMEIVFVTHYMNDPQKRRELARFTSYDEVPDQTKDSKRLMSCKELWYN